MKIDTEKIQQYLSEIKARHRSRADDGFSSEVSIIFIFYTLLGHFLLIVSDNGKKAQ